MPSKFEPSKKSISDLYFEPKVKYEIPKYQRPYSWKKEQHEEFWKLIMDGDSSYIGTVIYNVVDEEKKGTKEIIDGQQRYLTLTILASSLRNVLLESHKNSGEKKHLTKANDVHEELIGRRHRRRETYENFLSVGASAKEYFEKNIQFNNLEFLENTETEIHLDLAKSEEEKLVYSAHYNFKEKIKEKIESIGEEKTYKLILENLGKLFVISIEIDDYAMAFEIFESVNSQGVDLSVADLIKNQIFKNIEPEDYLNAEAKWAGIIESLEDLDIAISPKEFLRYHWASKFNYVGDAKLYKAIKKEYSKEGKKWSDFLSDVDEDSKTLSMLLTDTKGQWQQKLGRNDGANVYNTIRALKALKAKTWLVLVLSMIRSVDKFKGFGIKHVKQLQKIQMFTFYYFEVMGFAGNWYWIQMYTTAQQIYKAEKKEDIIKSFQNLNKNFAEKLKLATEDSFQEGFKSITYKNYGAARYVLSTLEQHLRGEESTGWDDDKVSIEHFMPQEPKEWGMKKSEIKGHINLLGNLVLISGRLNGKLGNKTCNDKLEVIDNLKADMELLKVLVKNIKNKTWDYDSITSENFSPIIKRQKVLGKIGFEIWVTDLLKKLGH